MVRSKLDTLQDAIGYRFRDPELLLEALTHSSYASESSEGLRDNEQLEFLGDIVLSFLVSVRLVDAFRDYPEGKLSRARAWLISAVHLARVATHLELGRCLRLGRGEEKTGGQTKPALLANALEALIAALFRDGGLEAAERFVDRFVLPPDFREKPADLFSIDFKSALQEHLQAEHQSSAEYRVTEESGPEHAKVFTVEVSCGANRVARGTGRSKKAAEQRAAELLLERLESKNGNDAGIT